MAGGPTMQVPKETKVASVTEATSTMLRSGLTRATAKPLKATKSRLEPPVLTIALLSLQWSRS